MNNFQWIKLKRDFDETRCILMIGPKLARIKKGNEWSPLVEELAIFLSDFLDQEGVAYDSNSKTELPYISQKFLNIKGARRVDLEDLTKDFYENNTPKMPEIYRHLAKLPVSIIINVNPDNFIQQALREEGKQCLSLHYNFRRETVNSIDIEKISIEKPLVYNLFGSLDETESIVLTEEDQLEFIRNVVKDDPRIPEEILGQFDHRKTYLFFGFDLENWQFRLLLDGLKLREENTTLSPKEDRYPVSETTKSFYEERFNFQFVDRKIDDFLDELKEKIGLNENDDQPKVTQKVFLIYDEKDEEFRIGSGKQPEPVAKQQRYRNFILAEIYSRYRRRGNSEKPGKCQYYFTNPQSEFFGRYRSEWPYFGNRRKTTQGWKVESLPHCCQALRLAGK